MNMKKFFMKLTAVALAVALSKAGITVERAEAATCPPHGSYYDTVMNGRDVGYIHPVKKDVYVIDEYGNMVELSDLTGIDYYVNCTVTFKELYVIVRCTKCHYQVGSYTYTTPEMHNVCAVG